MFVAKRRFLLIGACVFAAVWISSIGLLPQGGEIKLAEAPFAGEGTWTEQYTLHLFNEDFEDLSYLDVWNVAGSGFEVVETDRGKSLQLGAQTSNAHPRFAGWWNYAAEFQVWLDEDAVTGHATFWFREISDDTAYGLFITPTYIELQKNIPGGGGGKLDFDPTPLPPAEWLDVLIIAEEGYLAVYIEGEKRLEFVDDDSFIPHGGIRLTVGDGMILRFDNIAIWGEPIVPDALWTKTSGPHGGLGYDVRIDPRDHDIIYVTDTFSGVSKSVDGGESWFECNNGITARVGSSGDAIPVFCITIDPSDSNTLWAGTLRSGGIYKSSDGGQTWLRRGSGIDQYPEDASPTFRDFEVHPSDSNIVFVAAEIEPAGQGYSYGQIYKTEDGGESWHLVLEAGNLFRPIVIHPDKPNVVYAGTGIFDRRSPEVEGAFKSIDGGETWFQINNGMSEDVLGGSQVVGYLDIHPDDPDTLFAAVGRELGFGGGENLGGIFRTTNGGESWDWLNTDHTVFTAVSVSSSNPDVVYAAREEEVWRSNDGGDTWTKLGFNCAGYYMGIPIGIAVHPHDPNIAYIDSYNGGVYRTVDGGASWHPVTAGLSGARVSDICMVAELEGGFLVAAPSEGLFWSGDGGQSYDGRVVPYSSTTGRLAVSQIDSSIVYGGNNIQATVHISHDKGQTWEDLVSLVQDHDSYDLCSYGITSIIPHPWTQDVLWVSASFNGSIYTSPDGCDDCGIFKTSDGGRSWQPMSDGIPAGARHVTCLAMAPSNPSVLYAAVHQLGIYRSTDGGEHWVPASGGLTSPYISTIAVHPWDPSKVYAGAIDGMGVFVTTDGGISWTETNEGMTLICPSYLRRIGSAVTGISLEKPDLRIAEGPVGRQRYPSWPWSTVSKIVIDPIDPDLIYAGDRMLGVYASQDGGMHWMPLNDGLTFRAVQALSLSDGGSVLYAGTEGGGVYRLEVPWAKLRTETAAGRLALAAPGTDLSLKGVRFEPGVGRSGEPVEVLIDVANVGTQEWNEGIRLRAVLSAEQQSYEIGESIVLRIPIGETKTVTLAWSGEVGKYEVLVELLGSGESQPPRACDVNPGNDRFFARQLSVIEPNDVVFYDDFEEGNSGWGDLGRAWRIEREPLSGNRILQGNGTEGTYIRKEAFLGADFVLTLQVALRSGGFGIYLRQQQGGCYVVGMGLRDVCVSKLLWAGNEEQALEMSRAKVSLGEGQWYALEIEALGPSLTVRVDGEELLRVIDDELPFLDGELFLETHPGTDVMIDEICATRLK